MTHFPSKEVCNKLLRAYFDVFYQIRPVVPRCWAERALKEVFQLQSLAEPRTANGVTDAAVCIDSILPRSANPPFLNWNIVGVLLAMFALAAYTAPQLLDPVLLQSPAGVALAVEIRNFAFKMQNLVGLCWQLCNPHERPDESVVLLLYFYSMTHIAFGQYSELSPSQELQVSSL